ncbi:DMT family transporter [Candidatus Pelagibacter communis]|uniref:DMT family transporter n=1 Tax=Candidatus Pelagibacter TaxID=198251 RepID=UPI003EE0CB7F
MKAIILNASAWMIVPVMDALAKFLSNSMNVFQIAWARYFFSALFTLSLMLFFYKKTLVWSKNPRLQIIRGFVLAFSTLCFFYAISVISLPKALTLAFVAPITCTAFSPIFLNEKVGIRRWSAVLVGFLGALIVIRPGFIEVNLATLAAVCCGICYGFYFIITRKLSTSDNPLLTLLFTSVVGLLIISLFLPSVWVKPSLNEWIIMALIGLIASIAHLFLIISLKYADASKLAPLGYTEIITNILISYYYFNELPDNWTYLGLFIIVLSGLYIAKREYYLNKIKY